MLLLLSVSGVCRPAREMRTTNSQEVEVSGRLYNRMLWSPLFIRDKLLFYYALGLLNLAGERHMESKCSFSIERRELSRSEDCHRSRVGRLAFRVTQHPDVVVGSSSIMQHGWRFPPSSSLTPIDRSGVHRPSSVSYPLFTERRQTLSDVRYAARTISANLCRSGSSSCCQLALNVQSDLGHDALK